MREMVMLLAMVSGCGMSRPAAAAVGTIGLALAAGGAVYASQMDCSNEGILDFCRPSRAALVGMSTIVGVMGLVGVVYAITSDGETVAAPTAMPMAASSETAPVDRAPLPAMPEMQDRSKPQNRLAIQAAMIARAGNCTGAKATGQQLRRQDPALYDRLVVADVTFAACVK